MLTQKDVIHKLLFNNFDVKHHKPFFIWWWFFHPCTEQLDEQLCYSQIHLSVACIWSCCRTLYNILLANLLISCLSKKHQHWACSYRRPAVLTCISNNAFLQLHELNLLIVNGMHSFSFWCNYCPPHTDTSCILYPSASNESPLPRYSSTSYMG